MQIIIFDMWELGKTWPDFVHPNQKSLKKNSDTKLN